MALRIRAILIAVGLLCYTAGETRPTLAGAEEPSPVAGGTHKTPAESGNWPQFRGPFALGVSNCQVPTQWDVESGKNVKWKTRIPGLGHSSPIVWGNRVFVTTCVSGADDAGLRVVLYGDITPVEDDTVHTWRVYALDTQTGRIVWEKVAHKGVPRVKRHPKSTHANSTPSTDGRNVIAFFGSEGLFCYDLDGNLRWSKDFGTLDSGYYRVPEAQWGFGSSPIIYNNLVIVQCDVQGESFLAAFHIDDGREAWRTPREEVPTWSTPTVVPDEQRPQIIVNGYRHIGGYDFRTGEVIWRLSGGGDIPVPTPIVAHGLVYITNAHGGLAPIYAIHTSAAGEVTLPSDEATSEHLAWSYRRRGNYMQTPIVVDDYLFACRDNGVLTCFDAKNGKVLGQKRLGTGRTGFTASPIAADGKLFFSSEEGDVYVVKAEPEPEILHVNRMGEFCMATPAIADGRLFIRTQDHLFCIAG